MTFPGKAEAGTHHARRLLWVAGGLWVGPSADCHSVSFGSAHTWGTQSSAQTGTTTPTSGSALWPYASRAAAAQSFSVADWICLFWSFTEMESPSVRCLQKAPFTQHRVFAIPSWRYVSQQFVLFYH